MSLSFRAILLEIFLSLTFITAHSETPPQEFEAARIQFNEYRFRKLMEIDIKTGGYRRPSVPFALIHSQPTKYSALLIHGLNDSPYYMKDIAQILYENGFNVITILLPGHGVTPSDMHAVDFKDWIEEVNLGLKIAAQLGERVTVGGFSTGGLLAVNAALDSARNENPVKIDGLFLFAPALKINSKFGAGNRISTLTCVINTTFDTDLEENPVKYTTRSTNSICQLNRLMSHIYKKVDGNLFSSDADVVLARIANIIEVPTFLVNSSSDNHLDSESIERFSDELRGSKLLLHYEDLLHSYLVLKTNDYNFQVNPLFNHLERELSKFVAQYFE